MILSLEEKLERVKNFRPIDDVFFEVLAENKEVLEEIYLDDTVDLLEEMPANVVKRILLNSEPETRKQINEILKYPEDSAGSLMTTEYVSLRRDMTAYEAYNEGSMVDHIPTDEELESGFSTIPAVPGVQQAGGLPLA